MSDQDHVGRWDHWIPRGFILFFVALAGLLFWFASIATSTFSGLVTDQAYTTGLNYNEILEQRRAEQELNWTSDLVFVEDSPLKGRLVLTVRDGDGDALVPDNIRATAERMSRHPQIQSVDFATDADGSAIAALEVPLAGHWFLRLRIARGDDVVNVIHEIEIDP